MQETYFLPIQEAIWNPESYLSLLTISSNWKKQLFPKRNTWMVNHTFMPYSHSKPKSISKTKGSSISMEDIPVWNRYATMLQHSTTLKRTVNLKNSICLMRNPRKETTPTKWSKEKNFLENSFSDYAAKREFPTPTQQMHGEATAKMSIQLSMMEIFLQNQEFLMHG